MNAFTNNYRKIAALQPLSFWVLLLATSGMIFLFFDLFSGDFGAGFIVDKWATLSLLLLIIIAALFLLIQSLYKPVTPTVQSHAETSNPKPATMYVIKKPIPNIIQKLDANFDVKTADLLDQIPSPIWVGDQEGNRIWFNRYWTEFTGYVLDKSHTTGWIQDVHPDDCEDYLETQNASIATALPFNYEYRLKQKDGNFCTVIDYASPIFDKDDKLEGYVGFCVDISEREKAFQKLATSEKKFSMTFHASPELVTISRLEDGKIIEVNKTFEMVMGFTEDEVKGKTAEETGVWNDEDERNTYRSCMEIEGRIKDREIHMCTKSGKTVILLASAEILLIAGELCILSVAMDITARKKMEEELLLSRNNLQELTSMLTQAEEKERRKIAVDLHDNITQNLGLLKIICGQLSVCNLPDEAKTLLQSSSNVVEETITASRNLIHELSPPVLNELGFQAALRWLAEQMSTRYKINYDVMIENIEILPDIELQSTLFRIAREIMTNAGKYSSATTVNCSFREFNGRLELNITDDGTGFDIKKHESRGVTETGGFGLFSIRQSLEYLKGELVVLSHPDKGTSVTVSIPTHQK